GAGGLRGRRQRRGSTQQPVGYLSILAEAEIDDVHVELGVFLLTQGLADGIAAQHSSGHGTISLLANLATRDTAHQTVPADRDPGVDPTGEWQHTREPEERREPASARELRQEVGPRVRNRVDAVA